MPEHEGPRPDRDADPEGFRRWLKVRAAREKREGYDPRYLLMGDTWRR